MFLLINKKSTLRVDFFIDLMDLLILNINKKPHVKESGFTCLIICDFLLNLSFCCLNFEGQVLRIEHQL